jgi:CysZ protein
MFGKNFITAINSYIAAWQLVQRHKLYKIFFFSGLLYALIIGLGLYGIYNAVHFLADAFLNVGFIKKWSDNYVALKWLFVILSWGIYVSSFLVYFSLFKYVLLTVASPLYAYISERTESLLTGKQFEFSSGQLIKDIVRGLQLSMRNIFKQTFFTLLLLLLSFIPVVGLFSAFLILVVDCYYYGFAMIDYNCERHKMNVAQSLQFVKANRGMAIGNGFVFYLLFLIPFVGIVFGAPLSAMAACIAVHDKFDKHSNTLNA